MLLRALLVRGRPRVGRQISTGPPAARTMAFVGHPARPISPNRGVAVPRHLRVDRRGPLRSPDLGPYFIDGPPVVPHRASRPFRFRSPLPGILLPVAHGNPLGTPPGAGADDPGLLSGRGVRSWPRRTDQATSSGQGNEHLIRSPPSTPPRPKGRMQSRMPRFESEREKAGLLATSSGNSLSADGSGPVSSGRVRA